jgi:hypothetical protein
LTASDPNGWPTTVRAGRSPLGRSISAAMAVAPPLLPLKMRAFLDYAGPRLKADLANIANI